MNIVVLAQESASTWMMVNALREKWPSISVMLEKPVSRRTLLERRARRLGWWAVLGQLMFMALVPFLSRSGSSRRKELVQQARLKTERPSGIEIHDCESVNSPACIAWLREQRPDIVVVNGTRIISSAVLAASDAKFLNTHCGITPAYRGVHGGYWALYCNDPANAGVTVHLVNSGIDTGDILYQQTIDVDARDSFVTYPVKQYVAGIPLMMKAIDDIVAGRLQAFRRDDLQSTLWHHPTIWQYLSGRLLRGVR
ncbi:formyl transferase [uncultured Massilia sp.]|uniref:formyl transferase n=1 Tax=uncultured Massilia sp. TaxID=169973 RepID=UPI0025DCA6D1|nr:formyl transferase [uncultured Massilia sp.]